MGTMTLDELFRMRGELTWQIAEASAKLQWVDQQIMVVKGDEATMAAKDPVAARIAVTTTTIDEV